MDPDDRKAALNNVLLKAGALLLGIAVVVAGGTYLLVNAFGLNNPGDGGTTARVDTAPYTPLPSTALPVPDDEQAHRDGHRGGAGDTDRTDQADQTDQTERAGTGGGTRARGDHRDRPAFQLAASPVRVAPMERINLTGTYPGHDNVQLQVQRLENGTWADFPTQVVVQMGTFQTYVMTGHTGVNRFRVYDPAEGRGSNVVEVRVG